MEGGTELLLFFGKVKKICDIEKGDILINNNGDPNVVISKEQIEQDLYRLKSVYIDIIISEEMIIPLYNNLDHQIYNTPLKYYVDSPFQWQINHMLFYKPVNYPEEKVRNDPFMIGVSLHPRYKKNH